MNRAFLNKAFREIPRIDHQAMADKACSIILQYANDYGIDTNTEYYQTKINTILKERITRLSKIRGYRPLGITVDFIIDHLEQFKYEEESKC